MSRRKSLAEVRIYVLDGHRYGLWWWMEVKEHGDVYAGPPRLGGDRELFRLSHQPQPSAARKRLSIRLDNLPPANVLLWAVEPGRDDLVAQLRAPDPPQIEFIHVDWTTPH